MGGDIIARNSPRPVLYWSESLTPGPHEATMARQSEEPLKPSKPGVLLEVRQADAKGPTPDVPPRHFSRIHGVVAELAEPQVDSSAAVREPGLHDLSEPIKARMKAVAFGHRVVSFRRVRRRGQRGYFSR